MSTRHIHSSAWFIALATITAAPALMAQAPSHAKADPAKRADKPEAADKQEKACFGTK